MLTTLKNNKLHNLIILCLLYTVYRDNWEHNIPETNNKDKDPTKI